MVVAAKLMNCPIPRCARANADMSRPENVMVLSGDVLVLKICPTQLALSAFAAAPAAPANTLSSEPANRHEITNR